MQIQHRKGHARIVRTYDLQTLRPLSYASYDAAGGLLVVGFWSWRWSEDRPGYPTWLDDRSRPVRSLDLTGLVLLQLEDHDGWRYESWWSTSIPPDERARRRMLSAGSLAKKRYPGPRDWRAVGGPPRGVAKESVP